ncbi:hypothetical protein O6H91_13G023200 [Diphasiastrum complanatum]|uniref:Uncharacterized protein n=1 Tax=Diphasiastrum complanatum TaxID=34168 RepID=A0ACC2BT49_DIPCM|nr:hypothetical protein O6H91_13G023200 [Diphasiastrum complanatum]
MNGSLWSCGSHGLYGKPAKILFVCLFSVMVIAIPYLIQYQQLLSQQFWIPQLALQRSSSIQLEGRSERQQPTFKGDASSLYDQTILSSAFDNHSLSIDQASPAENRPANSSTILDLKQDQKDRVAICLVGGARAFELTGLTIVKYVLDVYNGADLFLHAPLDLNSYKFQLLEGRSNLAAIRIFKPIKLPETQLRKELLTSAGSPSGIQGLLQYFNLVEGCWKLITDYEKKHSFRYKWIIRTRVDGYWNGPIPGISSLMEGSYLVPYGSQFGGFNDRVGIGDRETSRVALQRLSLLPRLYNQSYRKLNSERLFRAQMISAKIKVKLRRFNFCILSYRHYGLPNGVWNTPVASISSKGPLNGAKCRPCTPLFSGLQAKAIAEALDKSWGWTGPTDGLELCDARHNWEQHWEDAYDMAAGSEFAAIRKSLTEQPLSECIKQVDLFRQQWEIWDAPSSDVICLENNRATPHYPTP